ncbi:ABC transporter ATP-binding protein [Gordonia sinesedis]
MSAAGTRYAVSTDAGRDAGAGADVAFDGVRVVASGRVLVDGVSLSARGGQFVGIIGPNGGGKSTLLRCIYRALTPAAGTVRIDGRDVIAISLRDNARQVAALTQSATLDFEFTAAEVVATGRLPHRRSGASRGARGRDTDACAAAMRAAGATDLADRSFTTLSGGEAQRVLIARAFAQEPRVLVLDEPTNHLDIRHQFAVLTAARDRGVTVIAALHDLNLAAQYCDVLVAVVDGRVAATGSPADIVRPEHLRAWFGVTGYVIAHPRLGVPQVIFDERQA